MEGQCKHSNNYFHCSFRNATSHFVTKIYVAEIVAGLLSDARLVAYFNTMRAKSELPVKKELALNLLEDMLSLYLRIRSHSVAKNRNKNTKWVKMLQEKSH